MAKLYFSHDIDARNSAELMKVRMKIGPEGYAIYFMLLEKLADAGDHRLEEDYQLLSFDLRCDADKIQMVAEGYDLFRHEGGFFWSPGLDKRMNAARSISEKRRQAGQNGATARWQKDGKTIANECQTDGKQMPLEKQADSTINLKINNNNKINNPPPQTIVACAREDGCAEEDEGVLNLDVFDRFDKAMKIRYPKECVISATDDNRLRRYLTCSGSHLEGMLIMFENYLVKIKDVSACRKMCETYESKNRNEFVDFETWKMLTSLATLSRSDQNKIRKMVRDLPDGMSRLSDAMKDIDASNGKIKMPSRYIISKLSI